MDTGNCLRCRDSKFKKNSKSLYRKKLNTFVPNSEYQTVNKSPVIYFLSNREKNSKNCKSISPTKNNKFNNLQQNDMRPSFGLEVKEAPFSNQIKLNQNIKIKSHHRTTFSGDFFKKFENEIMAENHSFKNNSNISNKVSPNMIKSHKPARHITINDDKNRRLANNFTRKFENLDIHLRIIHKNKFAQYSREYESKEDFSFDEERIKNEDISKDNDFSFNQFRKACSLNYENQ